MMSRAPVVANTTVNCGEKVVYVVQVTRVWWRPRLFDRDDLCVLIGQHPCSPVHVHILRDGVGVAARFYLMGRPEPLFGAAFLTPLVTRVSMYCQH